MTNDGNWLEPLLTGFLDEVTLRKVTAQLDLHRDTPLADLGLDSMAIMGLVLRIEDLFKIEIDYTTFNLEVLRTPATLERYLLQAGLLVDREPVA
ncbi:acyl carrier protein [Actinoplanes philippinensis]|uniref:acyl carrier protein n=1 Tax=Actinoplanes philippinensis TaxID=35752 RepID=UPI0033C553DF